MASGLAHVSKGPAFDFAHANRDGIMNSDATKALGLQSDYRGGSKDYLVWSILGPLMREGKMVRASERRHRAKIS